VARSGGGGPKQRPRGGAVVPGGAEQPRLDAGPRHLAVARRRAEEALLQSPGGGATPDHLTRAEEVLLQSHMVMGHVHTATGNHLSRNFLFFPAMHARSLSLSLLISFTFQHECPRLR